MYEISTVGVNESLLKISLSVFPNPTPENLTLQIMDYNNEMLTYQLFDLQGNLLENERVTKVNTLISTGKLPASSYLLHISDKNKRIKTFKIIKTQEL